MLQVKTKEHGDDEPHARGQGRSGQNAMPRLGARYGIVVDEQDHGYAGRNRDDPADDHPHEINIWAEFVADVKENPALNTVAECNQDRGASQRNSRQYYERERDQAFLNQSPYLGQLVTAA